MQSEVWIAIGVFLCLSAISLGVMLLSPKMPARHRDEETNAVIRLVANIFVVMTSLVFSLMLTSAKTTYEAVDKNIHAYATDLILLDRSLRSYGEGTQEARQRLKEYLQNAIANPARADDALGGKPDPAGNALDALGNALMGIVPADSFHDRLLVDIQQQYRHVVEQRWTIVEQSEGVIPRPLIGLLIAWLILIFASFGYRAPKNGVVIASFLVSAFLIAGSFYLVLDLDIPFHGTIQISDHPYRRALAELSL